MFWLLAMDRFDNRQYVSVLNCGVVEIVRANMITDGACVIDLFDQS